MTPSIGRIVHYQSYGTPNGEYLPEARAAIITAVNVENPSHNAHPVSLCIVNPTGLFFDEWVPFSEKPQSGFWNWPPRVDG